MSGEIHPADRSTIAREDPSRTIFNYEYPPPAFIGDVDNAPVVILMANGGYNSDETRREFVDLEKAGIYVEYLRHPGPIDPAFISPYYARHYAAPLIRSGKAVIVNACAYRSIGISTQVKRLADELPSVAIARQWLVDELFPAATKGDRLILVHRPGLWRSALPDAPNLYVANSDEWRLKALPKRFRVAIEKFLGLSHGSVISTVVPSLSGRKGRLSGFFVICNRGLIFEKANRDDPRAHFYAAMLSTSSFDCYYELAIPAAVNVKSYKSGPVSSDMEIKYAFRRGWIRADSKKT
jgi:hypothetical protein